MAGAFTDGFTTIASDVASASSPLTFDGGGTKANTLRLAGTAVSAGKWTGRVQYTVKVTRKG